MIDSTIFMADVPAGTYAVGDIIPLSVKYGSKTVRDGYGPAILKEIISSNLMDANTNFEFVIENSNLIDPIINAPGRLTDVAALDELSTGVQPGNNLSLEINSTWNVYAKCVTACTTTAAMSVFAQIDVDFPQAGGVVDPLSEEGIPTTLEQVFTVPINKDGTSAAAQWITFNMDILKPGYRYLMEKVSATMATTPGGYTVGFIAFANAAAQKGLSRVIPVAANAKCISKPIKYAEPLVKGPQDIRMMFFTSGTLTSDNVTILTDYVKRA